MPARKGIELRPAHLRALMCLLEARHLAASLELAQGRGYLWPGFDFRATPFLIYRGGIDAFLVQHPDPPTEFALLTLPVPGFERIPIYHHQGPLPYLPAVGPVEVGGHFTATLPLSVYRAGAWPETLVAATIHEAFHAYQASMGWPRTNLGLLSAYPELSATNNALGNLEATILAEFLAGRLGLELGRSDADPPDAGHAGGAATGGGPGHAPGDALGHDADDPLDARRTAYHFGLVRRERRGPLDDEIIDYEQNLETTEGLARYVEVKALVGASAPEYQPSRAFETVSGRARYDKAQALVSEQVAKLYEVNLSAAGAAWWRFFQTGMALGLFADFLDPGWKEKVERGAALDEVLEAGVRYDGGEGDEKTLEALKEDHGYDERLDAEREFSRNEKKRKEELLASILRGTGTRVTFDVSSLISEETWWDSGRFALDWDPSSVETITRNVRIHRKGLRFRGYGTDLRFGNLPVVEDLKNRLFHVSVKASRLGFEGDGHNHPPARPAEFQEGLEVVLPGVRARATSGFVQNTQGTLYIKITR